MQIFYTNTDIDMSLLEGLVDLPPAVAQAYLASGSGIDGVPFVLSATGAYDHLMSGFFRCLPMLQVPAENSWRTYAIQANLAAEFITGPCRRSSLLHATFDDFASYKRIRRNSRQPQVDAKTWNVQIAALEKFYQYALLKGFVTEIPFRYRKSRVVVNGVTEVRNTNSLYDLTPVDDVVRCLSLGEYEFFRDVGLMGMRPDRGGRRANSKCRNETRNCALSELLVTTGMRITECLVMFRSELPTYDYAPDRLASEALLSRGTTKRQKAREILVSHRVMSTYVDPYIHSDRANAVYKARDCGRYERLRSKRLAHDTQPTSVRFNVAGRIQSKSLDLLTAVERRNIFAQVNNKATEPLVLWCGEDGLPLSADAVRRSFSRACDSCNENQEAAKRFGRPMHVTPHTLRHTFAVAYLNQLIREVGLSIRRDLRGAEADDAERQRRVFMDPLNELRKRLGHSTVEATFKYLTYLRQAKATAFAAVEGWDALLVRESRDTGTPRA